MRRFLVAGSVLLAVAGSLAARPAGDRPLPERLADTGGGSQLITAEAPSLHSTTGTLSWWDLRGGRWHRTGTAAARFGEKGLADGATRRQGTDTTPTGIYDLPYAFGIKAAPAGTRYPYRAVRGVRGGARTTRPVRTTAGWTRVPGTAGPVTRSG